MSKGLNEDPLPLGSVYFSDWNENAQELESWDWKCGAGLGVCCLLTLE